MDTRPPTSEPRPTPALRPRRWLRRTLIGAGATLLLAGGAVWLLGREATLQQIMAKLAQASGGNLVASQVSGSLYGHMHIGRLLYRSADSTITVNDIDIDWSPLQYFSQGVAISTLHAASAEVRSTAAAPPPKMPTSLAPPFRLSLGDVQLAKLTLIGLDGQHTELSALRLQLQGDQQQWQLRQASVLTPAGRIAGSGRIASASPFQLTANASLTDAAAAPQARLDAALTGDLAQLSATIKGSSPYANGSGSLTLAPFEAVMLRTAALQARGVDPARFDPAWPKASLDLALEARVAADQTVAGQVTLHNRDPAGPFDQQQLPLQGASAQVGGTLSAAKLTALVLDLGRAGRLHGNGALSRQHGQVTAALQLGTERLDLHGLHSSASPSAIAGTIRLDSQAGRHTLHAALSDKKLRLDAQASLQDWLLTVQQARLQAGAGSVTLAGQASLKDDKRFRATAQVNKFDPSVLGQFPLAELNAALQASGTIAPAWQADAAFTLKPSRLLQQPLSGSGQLRADARHVHEVEARLALGRNSATVRGAFGLPEEQLAWQVEGTELAALDSRLRGNASASGVLGGGYQAPRSSFTLQARALAIARPTAHATAGANGLLRASGEAWLAGAARTPALQLSGNATHLDPAAFGAPLRGDIGADFKAELRLGADWQASGALTLQPSSLGGSPLSGHASLAADRQRVHSIDADLHLGPNLLQAKGSSGGAQDRLDWKVDAPTLAALGPGFGGVLRGTGYVSGPLPQAVLGFSLDGSKLRLPAQLEIDALKASATLGTALGANDPLQADISVAGLNLNGFSLQRARLQSSGTGGAHVLQASASNADFDGALRLHGGYAGDSWQGSIDTLQNRGRFALTLQAPATLRLAAAPGQGVRGLARPQQLALGSSTLRMPEGSVRIDQLEKDGPHWRSLGAATGVNASYLAQLSDAWRDAVASDMTLGADWSIGLSAPTAKGAPPALDGNLHVFREKGDLTITGGARPLPLGLRTLDARLAVAGNALRVQALLEGQRAGNIKLEASAQLQDGHIPRDSPLAITASADLPSLAWLSPLSGVPGLELDGALHATASGSGTVGAPQLDGEVTGDKLVLNWAEQGIRLRNGQLQARVRGDQLQLRTLRFDGVQGSAQAEGWLRLADGAASMNLKLNADKLEVLSRPDRTLVVSGNTTLVRDAKHFQLDGKLKADRASIELPALDAPTISDDVIILGREQPASKAASSALPLNIDVEADLGDDFTLKGKGLEAQLAGAARIRITDRRPPRVNGSVHVVSGTYAAYGQKLAVERGVLNFTGAYDNPGLNIRAVRRRPEGEDLSDTNVEAGVEVRGTALAPVAKLVSTPSVPDSEKLSWLVLGHGTADMAGNELGLLGTAAGALFGGHGGSSLANKVGLDELGVSQAKGLETTVVTVGKKLSARAYLSFEQGAGSATSLVKLRYKLNARVTLQVQTGTNNALDVLYSWAFD
jgi:translocation and assembly module TamB